MTAERIAKELNGRRTRAGWQACCPSHQDRDPSLSIATSPRGDVLIYCHAGCEQSRVIAALRALGLWPQRHAGPRSARLAGQRTSIASDSRVEEERTRRALTLWDHAGRAIGTHAEDYLKSRGLLLPIPPSIRFSRALKHPAGGSWPAMVALVTRGLDEKPVGIHRTFLDRDGASKSPAKPNRMMLGPCRGGAVRLGPVTDKLMVGEGIETCLAVMQVTGRPAWAALSTSGLRGLRLDKKIREVTVLADGDDPGESAAGECARRWEREGRKVRIARPPRGLDFNDLLLGRSTEIEGSVS